MSPPGRHERGRPDDGQDTRTAQHPQQLTTARKRDTPILTTSPRQPKQSTTRTKQDGFTMIPNWFRGSGLSAWALYVYYDLRSYAWTSKGAWPTEKTIADDIGTSKRTVKRAIRELERFGALVVDRHPPRSNQYRFPEVAVARSQGDTGGPRSRRTEEDEPTRRNDLP